MAAPRLGNFDYKGRRAYFITCCTDGRKEFFRDKKKHGGKLWQSSYYDHVLRREVSMVDAAKYIFENPIRKGLVTDIREYPYIGSYEFSIKDFL